MKTPAFRTVCALAVLWLVQGIACAGDVEFKQAAPDHLYTTPEADVPGGIKGHVAAPARPIEKVLAIPADEPSRVYIGDIGGADQQAFRFRGLPMDRYDLVVIYEDAFYEGLRLHRGESELTESDLSGIRKTIERSEPFFSHKIIHRVEGATGRGGDARAICTYYRETPAETYIFETRDGYRRTFKLVMLRDVGPGWQIVRARDLHPIWTTPEKQRAQHAHRAELSGIRVTDSMRVLGELVLDN